MPELVLERVGGHFTHRDTRLKTPKPHPVVVKSVDVTDLCTGPQQVRFDYGYGGDKRLYVEIAVYKPRPGTPWTHHCYEVQALLGRARPDGFSLAAETLGLTQEELVSHVARFALSLGS